MFTTLVEIQSISAGEGDRDLGSKHWCFLKSMTEKRIDNVNTYWLHYQIWMCISYSMVMKIEALKKRLDRNRPMTSITIRMPEDVIEDLKRVAPLLGFSGYQPLLRAYIGQGLRSDLERLEGDTVSALIASLKRHGVSDEVIHEALSEVTQQ